MKSLCKVVTITVFLTFSYSSAVAANNNIKTDTHKNQAINVLNLFTNLVNVFQ